MSNIDVYSAMQTDEPHASYKKTILGMVAVKILDPFDNAEVIYIMKGDPNKDEKGSIIDVWSRKEDVFFQRRNERLFERKILIPYTRKEVHEPTEEEIFNSMQDEELENLVTARWYEFKNAINKMTSTGTLYNLLGIAERLERPEKTITAIKARLSELTE